MKTKYIVRIIRLSLCATLLFFAAPELSIATIALFTALIVMHEAQIVANELLSDAITKLIKTANTQDNTIALQNEIQNIQNKNIIGLYNGLGLKPSSEHSTGTLH